MTAAGCPSMLLSPTTVQVRQRKLEEGRVGKYKGKLRRLPARLSATGQRWRRKRLGTPST